MSANRRRCDRVAVRMLVDAAQYNVSSKVWLSAHDIVADPDDRVWVYGSSITDEGCYCRRDQVEVFL